LETLKLSVEEIESQGVEGAEDAKVRLLEDDEVVLKLKFYRSLGIDVDADKATGRFNRVVVRNMAKGDVQQIWVGDDKMTSEMAAKCIWDRI
jgi:kinetochore protein Spc24, fungi type